MSDNDLIKRGTLADECQNFLKAFAREHPEERSEDDGVDEAIKAFEKEMAGR